MSESEWSPNPEIVARLKNDVDKVPKDLRDSVRINVDGRLLTWNDVIKEIQEGTPFGRQYYRALAWGQKRQ